MDLSNIRAKLDDFGTHASSFLCEHSNLYRAAKHWDQSHESCIPFVDYICDATIGFHPDFEDADQDKVRDPLSRKLCLARTYDCGGILARYLACHVGRPVPDNIRLHRIRKLRDKAIGPRHTLGEIEQYIRRAARKIHPDKISDLEDWPSPHRAEDRPYVGYISQNRAFYSCGELLRVLLLMRELHQDPAFVKALSSRAASRGGSLTVREAMPEFAAISAFMCLFGAAGIFLGASTMTVAALWAVTRAGRELVKRYRTVSCRALVVHDGRPLVSRRH